MAFTISRAFAGNSEVFHVDHDGGAIVVFTGAARRLPTAEEQSSVDKIVFFDESTGKIVLVVPFIPATVQVTQPAALEIGGSVRAYFLRTDAQFISLELALNIGAGGRPQFLRFFINKTEPNDGFKDVRFDQIAQLRFAFDDRSGLPHAMARIGINPHANQPDKWLLQFNPEFTFRGRRFLSGGKQEVVPFALEFDGGALPHTGHDPSFTTVEIRQPRVANDRVENPAAWPADHWVLEFDVPANAVAERWQDAVVEPYLRALHTVQDGRPVSLLPSLPKGTNVWRVKLSLIDRLGQKTVKLEDFVIRQAKAKLPDSRVAIVPRTLEPQKPPFTADVTFSALPLTDGGKPLTIKCEIGPANGAEGSAEADLAGSNEGFFFGILHKETKEENQRLRVGALDLIFDPGTPTFPSSQFQATGDVRVSFRSSGAPADQDDPPGLPRVETLNVILGGIGIRPGNQDPIPGEEFNESSFAFSEPDYDRGFRRGVPLLVDLSKDGNDDRQLILQADESAIEHESQTITMKLLSQKDRVRPIDTVIIDSEPFLVARVQVNAADAATDTAVTAEIGNWSNRSADLAWEIASAAKGFELVLPPQGVGETMEKRRGDFLDDTKKNEVPADFRFTPNARFALRSSFFRQRFVEAPWNLRRVLGYPGQRAAGAGVDKLRFELFYGLSAQVENRTLRLAELAARLGELPGRQSATLRWRPSQRQIDIYRKYRQKWRAQYPSLLSRLAILEPYEEAREGTLAITDAEGVSYELRSQGVSLHDPIDHRRDDPEGNIKFDDRDGLKGGWSWGFESENILNAVLRQPKSSSGLLARPFFSALGGWGFQKASFDRNLSTIYSDTSMGRTFSVSIERIGRISVFWNRAKHVIVYERTVAPTRQFFAEQDRLLGIPVLRKVREYVEILQDERTYPEFGETPMVRGFVRACLFPEGSRRINVNSSWGEDVGRIGWKVPLWRRGVDPVVYPRPSITVKAAGDHPDKVNPLTLSEPEKLSFFTNTDINQPANSDLWPAVLGIDYPQLRDFKNVEPRFGTGTVRNPQADTAPPVLTGHGGFTFAVDPSPHAVDIVHERVEQAIGAILQNVTVVRGPLEAKVTTTIASVRDVVDEAVRRTGDFEKTAGSLTEILDHAKKELDEAKTELDNLVSNVPLTHDEICARITEAVGREFDRAVTARGALIPIVDQLKTAIADFHANVDSGFQALREQSDQISATARAKLQAARNEIHDEVLLAIRSVQGAAGAAPRALDRALLLIDAQKTAIADRLEDVKTLIKNEEAWTDSLRKNVDAKLDEIGAVAGAIEQQVEDVSRSITGPIPDKARIAVHQLANGTRLFVLRVKAVENAATTIKPKELANEIKQMQDDVTAAMQKVIDILTNVKSKLIAAIENKTLETTVNEVDQDLKDAIDNSAKWIELLDTVRKRFDDLFPFIDAAIDAHVKQLRDAVTARTKLICDELIPTDGEIRDALRPFIENARDTLEQVLKGTMPLAREVVATLEHFRLEAAKRAAELAAAAGKLGGEIIESAERTFRLLRAFGEVPRVPGLGFDATTIAYHFIDEARNLLPHVDLSPVLTFANEVADDLKNLLAPLGTKLPSIKLLERVVPFNLENFNLNSVFPDFAGLKLDGLFSNLRMPKISNEYVRITHGFDQQAMRGWVQADADVPFDQPATMLSIAGITLTLVRGRFKATSRIDAAAGQSPRQSFSGEISGEWALNVGNFDLVSFIDTKLTFDDSGHIRFDVSPDRVQLQAVLKFVSDLMAGLGYSDSGFSIRVLPTGIQSTLDLPLPDIQGGAFGLANLRLGSLFELDFVPEFVIATRFFVGSKLAPFSITIFILGGAGWVDARVKYTPSTKVFESEVSVAITASASLAIALGPIKGGVFAYFGITVDYKSSSNGVSDLRIGLLLMFRGEVSLLGFLSVSLCLALEAQYTSGGGLIGRGHVSYSIKICWCVTINVSSDVSYTFGSTGGTSSVASSNAPMLNAANLEDSPFKRAATEYVDMFEVI